MTSLDFYLNKSKILVNKLVDPSYVAEFTDDISLKLKNKNSISFFNHLNLFSKTVTTGFTGIDNIVSANIESDCLTELCKTVELLKPWRKGPFKFNDYLIDSEWRCYLKYDRLKNNIDFKNATVLDVGSGNGYYLYRMLGDGARLCLGLDPHLLYFHQYLLMNACLNQQNTHLLPLGWQHCNQFKPCFDYVLCMGVLYHQKSPENLLSNLKVPLMKSGALLLETLIIESKHDEGLIPKSRYAAMKNVFEIPSQKRLLRWVKMAGFKDIKILDVSETQITEQRQTPLSSGMSLVDFLDPEDNAKTIEGYPRPVRILLKASL